MHSISQFIAVSRAVCIVHTRESANFCVSEIARGLTGQLQRFNQATFIPINWGSAKVIQEWLTCPRTSPVGGMGIVSVAGLEVLHLIDWPAVCYICPSSRCHAPLRWLDTFRHVLSVTPRCRQIGSPLPSPGADSVEHMGCRLRQPVWLHSCDVQHLIEATGALLHLPEQQVLRPRSGQHRGGVHPQLGRWACTRKTSCRPHSSRTQVERSDADLAMTLGSL